MNDEVTPKQTNVFSPLFAYCLEHPAVCGSLLYFTTSCIGVGYTWFLYRDFKINIFYYAETNDFLLAAFKEPLAVIGLIFNMLLFYGSSRLIFAWSKDKRNFRKFSTLSLTVISICMCALLTFSLITTAQSKRRKLVKNKQDVVNVLYQEGKEKSLSIVKELEASFIGTTEKFMFFYNHSEDNTIIIPIARIINITSDKLGFKKNLSSNKDK
jgi:hypothetical protein